MLWKEISRHAGQRNLPENLRLTLLHHFALEHLHSLSDCDYFFTTTILSMCIVNRYSYPALTLVRHKIDEQYSHP